MPLASRAARLRSIDLDRAQRSASGISSMMDKLKMRRQKRFYDAERSSLIPDPDARCSIEPE